MILYLIILIILFGLELTYFKIADKLNIIDKPNLRSSHSQITLRGGGIIFILGAWLWAIIFGGFQLYPYFLAGLTAISAISFADDVHSIPNRYRIVIQFASMLLMMFQWGIITASMWWAIIAALIVTTGIINAYNFMDGINGITGAYSLSVILPLIIANGLIHFIEHSLLIVTVISLIVFLIFNFRKRAKCFAGDVGAVGMAFIVTFSLGLLITATKDFSYIVLLAVYGVDSVLTIIHRLMLKENIFKAHRKHAYQIMANELKIPHLAVSSIYAAVQLIISLGFIYFQVNHWIYLGTTLLILIGAYIVFMNKYYHLHAEYLAQSTK